MKIALCIAGQPRSYKEGYDYYKNNLLDHYDVDVFIHSWFSPESFDAIRLYKPKDYVIDDPLDHQELINGKYTNTPNAEKYPPYFTVSSYYSIFQTCLMKRKSELYNGVYDFVIKTRFDFALPIVLPFDKMVQSMVYMPPCRCVWGDWLGNDQFAVGGSSIMNEYMSTYLYMDDFYSKGTTMIGEEMLRSNLIKHGIHGSSGRLAYLQMPAPFPPGEHNGTPHFLIRDDYKKWTSKKN